MAWDDEVDYGSPESSEDYYGQDSYGGGNFGSGDSYIPNYGGGNAGGGGYPSMGYQSPAQMQSEIDEYAKSEAEWAKRGSAGAPKGGSSSWIVSGGGQGLPGQQAVKTMSSRPVVPTAPTLNYPTFKMPEYDEAAVRNERQKVAAPYLRTLRQNVQKVMTQNYDNPNVKRMTLRDALGGYGTALESVMSRAESEGRRAYGEKYSKAAEEAKTNYSADVNKANAQWQAEVNRQNSEYQSLVKEWMAQNYTQSGNRSNLTQMNY